MLFEAFLIFWLLELLVLISVGMYYFYEPKEKQKKIYDPWGFWKGEKK
jgi:hypothetical protein